MIEREKNPEQKRKELPPTMVVVRSFIEDDEGKILILQRKDDTQHNPSKWELPGGTVEKWQANIFETIETEILEETGFLVSIEDKYRAVTISKRLFEGPYSGLFYLEHVYRARLLKGKFRLSPDHQGFDWRHPEEALNQSLSPEARIAITYHMGLISK